MWTTDGDEGAAVLVRNLGRRGRKHTWGAQLRPHPVPVPSACRTPAGAVCVHAGRAAPHPPCLRGPHRESPFLCSSPRALPPSHRHRRSLGWPPQLLVCTEAAPPCSGPPRPLPASPQGSTAALPAWPGVVSPTKTERILPGRHLQPSLLCHVGSAHRSGGRNSAVLHSRVYACAGAVPPAAISPQAPLFRASHPSVPTRAQATFSMNVPTSRQEAALPPPVPQRFLFKRTFQGP